MGDGTDYTTSLDLTSATNAEVEAALEALDGVYDVSVSDGTADSGSFTGNAWDITFHSPTGDVSNLVVLDSSGDDDGDVTYNVVELVRTARGNHKLQLDFNVRVFERLGARSSTLCRELTESKRLVQKSAKTTAIRPS